MKLDVIFKKEAGTGKELTQTIAMSVRTQKGRGCVFKFGAIDSWSWCNRTCPCAEKLLNKSYQGVWDMELRA